MAKERVYLSLGSNIGDSVSLISQAFAAIASLAEVELVKTSSLYETRPVSSIVQRDFINAACALDTTLSADALYEVLHQIELQLGKTPKQKDAPRSIDIDILLFGMQLYDTPELCIPHPFWKERLFVLIPLAELTQEIAFPTRQGKIEFLNLKNYLLHFPHPHNAYVRYACEAAYRGYTQIPI